MYDDISVISLLPRVPAQKCEIDFMTLTYDVSIRPLLSLEPQALPQLLFSFFEAPEHLAVSML